MAQVRYIAVARVADKTPVATQSFCGASHSITTPLLDDKLDRVLSSGRMNEYGRLTITDQDVGSIHYDSDPACLYMVITAKDYPQRLAFKMLGDIRTSFENSHADDFNKAKAHGLDKKTKSMFNDIAAKYENAGVNDKIASVSLQVDEVKGAMQNNINTVLKNQDNLENLLESSGNMRNDANSFQRSAVQAKNRFWYQNVKLMVAIVVGLIVLGLVIALPIVKRSQTEAPAAKAAA